MENNIKERAKEYAPDPVDPDCSFFLAKEEQIANIDNAIRKLEDKKSKLREL